MKIVKISKESVEPFVINYQKYQTNFVRIIELSCWFFVSLEFHILHCFIFVDSVSFSGNIKVLSLLLIST